jgi:predicted RNA-binding protein with TRAM domain
VSNSYSGRRNSSRSRFNIAAPVELNEKYEAEIEDISRRGDGIARIKGFVIFIPNTKQGEHVKFKIMRVGRRFAIGELVQT